MNLRWKIAQFFEIRWWKHYWAGKEKSDYLNWKENYWKRFLAEIEFRPAPGEKVLDAGCGPSGIFMVLTHQKVDAIDPLLTRYCQEIPQFQPDDYPHTQFYCEKIEQYFPDYQYDTIFCLNAINHVADLPGCMDRLSRLTSPHGTLVLAVDAHKHRLLKRIFQIFPGDILHPHQYDLVGYHYLLTASGFQLKRSKLLRKDRIFDYWVLIAKKTSRPD